METVDIADRLAAAFRNLWSFKNEFESSEKHSYTDAIEFLEQAETMVEVVSEAVGVLQEAFTRIRGAFKQLEQDAAKQPWAMFSFDEEVEGLNAPVKGVAGCVGSSPRCRFFRFDTHIFVEFFELDKFIDVFHGNLKPPESVPVFESRLSFILPTKSVYESFAGKGKSVEAQGSEYASFEMLRNLLSLPHGAASTMVTLAASEKTDKQLRCDYVAEFATRESAVNVAVEVAVTRAEQSESRRKAFVDKIDQVTRKLDQKYMAVPNTVKEQPATSTAKPQDSPSTSSSAEATKDMNPSLPSQPQASSPSRGKTAETTSPCKATLLGKTTSPAKTPPPTKTTSPAKTPPTKTTSPAKTPPPAKTTSPAKCIELHCGMAHLWSIAHHGVPLVRDKRCLLLYTETPALESFEKGPIIKVLLRLQ